MEKVMSSQAAAAKEIRKELKDSFPGVKFSVRSQGFSGGNAVDVEWTDGPKSADVRSIISKYQYGHFDGMTDMYEYSNSNHDIPQAKYVMDRRNMSDETRESIKADISKKFGVNMDDDKEVFDKMYCWPQGVIYREFAQLSL